MKSNKVVPEGWQIVPLSQVAQVQTGIAKGKVIEGDSVSIPYLRVANVQDGHIDFSLIKEISVTPGQVDRYRLRAGDVLFTEGGDFDKLGRGTVWSGEIDPCLHQNHVFAVRTDGNELLPDFLAYQAAAEHGRRYFQLSSKQSTNLASINSTQLKNFQILRPPIFEQRKITGILQTWDEAIEKLETLRSGKQNRFVGLLQLLLGRGGAFPERWVLRPLSDITTRISNNNDGKNHPVMTISAKSGFLKQSDKFSRDMAGRSVDRYIVLREGDFAYNKGNSKTALYGCIFPLNRPSALVPFVYFCFTIDRNLNHEFFTHLFASGVINHQLSRLINSGVRNDGLLNLSAKDFFTCKVPVPPVEEQEKIGAILFDAKTEIGLIEKNIEALKTQKRGLMQKLLTGEWRVKTANTNDQILAQENSSSVMSEDLEPTNIGGRR